MANRFLNNIRINDEYTLPENDGSAGQAILTDGSGNLSFGSAVASSADSSESIHITVKNTSGAQIAKGTPVYVTGETGNSGKIEIAPADASDESKMPALGILESTLNDNAEGFCVQGGLLEGLATDTIDGTSTVANDTVYVKAGGGLTLTKPTGSGNLIQNIAKVARVHASNGSLIVSSILRTNDVPNLPTGKIWVGNGSTIVSDTVFLDEPNGRMGIGTISPDYPLDVTGDIKATAAVRAGTNLIVGGYTDVTGFINHRSDLRVLNKTASNWLHWAVRDTSASEAVIDLQNIGSILTTGNATFGNDISLGGNLTLTTNARYLRAEDSAGTTTRLLGINGSNTTYIGPIDAYAGGSIFYGVSANVSAQTFYTGASARMHINSTGNVGIGTDNPAEKLDVSGRVLANAFRTDASTSDYSVISRSSAGNAPLYVQSADSNTNQPIAKFFYGNAAPNQGTIVLNVAKDETYFSNTNVGIGTTSPSQKLHVNGSAVFSPVGSTTPTLDLVSSNGSSDPFTRYYDESNGPSWCTGLDVSDEKYKISFDYDNTSISTSTKLTIDTAGKVGIGTTNPRSKLDVAGGVRIANDSAAASALNVGTLRYRTSGNNSYVDMCMQTGASTYAWVNIVQNNW